MKEEKIVVPILGPGENDQEYSQLKTEKDENQDQYFVDHRPNGDLILHFFRNRMSSRENTRGVRFPQNQDCCFNCSILSDTSL